jgi:threonine/homoserine/homoserine lactone efflux protein
MTAGHALIAFAATAALLTITPGLDTALVLRTAAVEGRQRAMLAGAGICLGCLTWGLAASLGIGLLFTASRLTYNGLRLVGAGYLIFLGVKMFRAPSVCPIESPWSSPVSGRYASGSGRAGSRWFARGLLTNLLNPKVGVFYLTFLPQFVPPATNVAWFSMLLAAIHALEGILWFALLTLATGLFTQWLRCSGVAALLDRVTGAILVGCGIILIVREQ